MYGEQSVEELQTRAQFLRIVDSTRFDYNTDEFASIQQDPQFHILRESLLELEFDPEIGDIVEWNYGSLKSMEY